MVPLSSLREQLRTDLDDILRLAKDRVFENETLEAALFQGLQQHNKTLTWQSLPTEEEQLILLLAKSKIAWDKALAFGLDPKMTAGQGMSRDKSANATFLKEIAKDLREEYRNQRNMIDTSQSETGDIYVGTLTRTSRITNSIVPAQAALRPGKPRLTSAAYHYDPILLQGTVTMEWGRMEDFNLAFVKVIISQNSPVRMSDTVIRTLYDVVGDPIAIPPAPPLNQQSGSISYTVLPTGRWYIALFAWNWNRLSTMSDTIPLDVANSLNLSVDALVLQV